MRTTLREIYDKGVRKVIVNDIFKGLIMEMILKDLIDAWSLHTEDGKWWGLTNEVTVKEIDGEYVVITTILSDEEVTEYIFNKTAIN